MVRPYEWRDRIHFSLRFEMNLNQIRVERVIYGIFDWLGDIGGFKEALSLVSILVLSLTTFEPMKSYMIKAIYEYKSGDDPPDSDKK